MNSNEISSPIDVYGSDGKLNFLCSLDLYPTPLIKNCPNATKKWLRAIPNVTAIQDIGINARYDELEHSLNKMNFVAVNMVDTTENNDNSLIFPALSADNPSHHSENTIYKFSRSINKNVHDAFNFDKDKYKNTYSNQFSLEKSAAGMPIKSQNEYNGTTIQNVLPDVGSERPLADKILYQHTSLHGKDGMLNIDTTSHPFDVSEYEHQHCKTMGTKNIPFQNPKKIKIYKDLQDTVMNEIIIQEINQTVFAKVAIGKTQGYLSELLKNSKLLESRSEKEYRRSRHNLDKIKQFLRKPNSERKRKYDEVSNNNSTVISDRVENKQRRTFLSADIKTYLLDYYQNHEGKLCNEDLQFLSSHLKLELQNVKIFYKNLKQRSKIAAS